MSLKELWTASKEGCLSPLEQSRAWALREVYRENEVPEKKMYTLIASKVTKTATTGKKKTPPTARAILKLFSKIDSDPDWYPGKVVGGCGRKPALSPLAKSVIARSAMTLKKKGGEPTYRRMLGTCKEAVKNPSTGSAVGKKRVYDIFESQCYDHDPAKPWKHRRKFTKTTLPDQWSRSAWIGRLS